MQILPHQQQCLDAIRTSEERTISFQMATGSGKTRVLLAAPASMNYTRVVYVFPTLGLTRQFIQDYLKEFSDIFPHFKEASSNSSLTDSELKEKLSGDTFCIITTYDSLSKVLLLATNVDCVLFDEAHHADAPNCAQCMKDHEAKIKRVLRASATLNETDTPCFTYPFHQAVQDGVCRDYSTYCFIKKTGSEHELITYLEEHRKQTGNSKVMVFTTFTEAEKEGTTNVHQFIDTYRDSITRMGGWIDGIVSSQSSDERQKLLKTFETNDDDRLSILVSCRTIGEGVDTKKANVVLFIDPIRSTIMIIQRIGRGTRVYRDADGVPLPVQRDGSVIVGIYIDPTKYENKTEEEIDQLLKENMSETGDFSAIFCVLAALRATDPETYYQCIHFLERQKTRAHKKEQGLHPIEVPRDGNCFFSCIGLQTGETHRHVRQRVVDYMEDNPEMYEEFLSDEDDVDALREEGVWNTDAMDVVVRAAADMLGQTIRIHHPDGRIDEVGEGEQLNVLLEDDHYTFLTTDVARAERSERERTDRTGCSRKKLFIDIDPDFKIMWKVSGDLTKDFTARIDAEIEHDGLTMEERSLVRANEFKDFYEKNGEPRQIHKPKTEEEKTKSSLAGWFRHMKDSKNGKGQSKLYPSVEKILVDLLGETWFENKDLENSALLKANEFKYFYETNQRKPIDINKPKTPAEKIEKSLAQWFGHMKLSKKGHINRILYPSVEKILVGLLGETWFENEDLEQNALLKANEFKNFYEKNQRKPIKSHTPKTPAEKIEKLLAQWFHHMKKGKGQGKLYQSVEKILIDLLGENWFENEDLEQNALLKANEFKNFYEKNQRKPIDISKPKTPAEKIEKSLAQWFGDMKKIKKGKRTRGKLYPSIEKVLVDLLGENWFENEDLEQNALLKANEYKVFYENNQRPPTLIVKPKEEEKPESLLASWFASMKQAKKGKGTQKLYPSVEKILVDLLGENWFENEDFEQTALLKANEFKHFYETNKRKPTRPEESSLSYWFSDMKKAKKGKRKQLLYPSVEKILIDLLGETWFENKSVAKEPSKHKPMTRTITPSTSLNPQPPHLSQLSLYHKEYKTLHSSNLAAKFKERPQLWSSYHQVAEANELSFPDGQVPYQRVIAFLQTHLATFHPKKHKTIVDMGCGTARVHRAFADRSNLTFHNLDHVACDDRVTVADISHTELEDGDADVVILCLALWGSNKEEYFKEAFRLLDPNGRLILIEPSKRWMDETGHRLRDTLLRHGFTIVQEDFMTGDQVNKFSLFVVKK